MTEWKDVVGYGGHYQVSLCGMVRVKARTVTRKHPTSGVDCDFQYKSRLLNPSPSKMGYKHVRIGWDGKEKTIHIARLVLETFVVLVQKEWNAATIMATLAITD